MQALRSVSLLLLLLLSRFSRVWLWANPETAAHQAPPSLGCSRQEHWSGLPFPSPMHESEKWKWSRSAVSDPQRPHGLQPTKLLLSMGFSRQEDWSGCHCQFTTALYFVVCLYSIIIHISFKVHFWFCFGYGKTVLLNHSYLLRSSEMRLSICKVRKSFPWGPRLTTRPFPVEFLLDQAALTQGCSLCGQKGSWPCVWDFWAVYCFHLSSKKLKIAPKTEISACLLLEHCSLLGVGCCS